MSVRAQQLMPPSALMGQQRNSAVDPGPLLFSLPLQGSLVLADYAHLVQQQDYPQPQQTFMGAPASTFLVDGINTKQAPLQETSGLPKCGHSHNHGQPAAPPAFVTTVDCTAAAPAPPRSDSRKRRKETGQIGQLQPQVPCMDHLRRADLNQTQLVLAPQYSSRPLTVSTGLRLAFDDERSTVTSSLRPCSTSGLIRAPSLMSDEIAAQMSSYQEDMIQVLRAQADQLRQTLLEKTQVHVQDLLASVEAELSCRVRETEAEMERMSKRNRELEERVRQLCMEREMWQSKARSNEEMVAMLRTNLQQVMVQVQQHQSNIAAAREQMNRAEGCGDSEVDDAASVYLDENLPAQQSRAIMADQQRNHHVMVMNSSNVVSAAAAPPVMHACRRCGRNEASVLLLPCLHLCLCIACNSQLIAGPAMERRCPVCSNLASNSAEIYLC